jgi:hypothetical protein
MTNLNIVSDTKNDFTSTYDLIGGNQEYIIKVSTLSTMVIEVIAGSFNYGGSSYGTNLAGTLDGTVDLYQSADGENEQAVTGATQIVLDAAQKVAKFEFDQFNAAYLHISVAQGSITGGTVRLMYTFK